jgi:hypothetical protein
MVSRVKKSVASRPVAGARRKVRQSVSVCGGAGPSRRQSGSAGWWRFPAVPEADQFAWEASVAPAGILVC